MSFGDGGKSRRNRNTQHERLQKFADESLFAKRLSAIIKRNTEI